MALKVVTDVAEHANNSMKQEVRMIVFFLKIKYSCAFILTVSKLLSTGQLPATHSPAIPVGKLGNYQARSIYNKGG